VHHSPRGSLRDDAAEVRIAIRIVAPDALQRRPGAHIVPSEIASEHEHPPAPLEHAHVDAHAAGDGTEERLGARLDVRQCRAEFRRDRPNLVEQVLGGQAKIPEFQRYPSATI